MKSYLIAAGAAVAAMTFASSAQAVVPVENTYNPGDPEFRVRYLMDGTISATIGREGISADFIDTYSFDLLTDGIGGGTVSGSFTNNAISMGNSFRIDKVTINGTDISMAYPGSLFYVGRGSFVNLEDVPLFAGPNTIMVYGSATGNVAYGGSITFVPNAVPEPATWAMMLVGFGMVAGTMRYRRRATKVVYA